MVRSTLGALLSAQEQGQRQGFVRKREIVNNFALLMISSFNVVVFFLCVEIKFEK